MSSEESPSNILLAWYRRFIGEPETTTDVYVGFTLFFGGIAFGTLGVVVFLSSTQFEAGSDLFWSFRRIAVVLAALGLPALMMGIIVLLPVGDRALGAAGVGIAICVIALGVFATTYPSNWNVSRAADYSAHGIALYSTGLAVVSAATAAALVGHHLERAAPTETVGAAPDRDGDEADGATAASVSEDDVRRDIEDAMRDVEYSWGGIRKARTTRLKVDVDDRDIDRSGFEGIQAKTTRSRSNDVDDAVSGLQQLKGGNPNEATGEGIDDQASALSDLRAKRNAEELATDDRSRIDRLKDRLGAAVRRD